MTRKLLITATILLLATMQTLAQRQIRLAEYHFNPLSYNPAYAGSQDTTAFILAHREQWAGIEGAPQTTYMSVHSPTVKNTHLALGADFMYDKVGVSSISSFYVDISYYVRLNSNDLRLSFGIKGGFNAFSTSLNDLIGGNDPLQNDVDNSAKGNFGVGAYLYSKKSFIGISALSILESSMWDDNRKINIAKLKRQIYLTAGHVFDINSNFKIRPTAVLNFQDDPDADNTIVDGELAANLYNRIWIGAGYDSQETIRAYLMLNVTHNLRVGYNYSYINNDLGKYTGGTHEIMIAIDLFKKNSRFF